MDHFRFSSGSSRTGSIAIAVIFVVGFAINAFLDHEWGTFALFFFGAFMGALWGGVFTANEDREKLDGRRRNCAEDCPCGCHDKYPKSIALRDALITSYTPPNYTRRAYTPHHIQPVCWGGNNSPENGVFLLTTDPANLHAQFGAWWKKTSFSPDGTSNPQPTSDDDC